MSVKSWHDSDEVDSDEECEAYNMLYYDIEKKNFQGNGSVKFEDLAPKLQLESDNESEEILKDDIVLISDSDDNFIEKKIICTNRVSGLFIGSTSDESDFSDSKDIDNKSVAISDLSFSFNTNVAFKDLTPSTDIVISSVPEIADWSVDNVDILPKSKSRSRYFEASESAICNICMKKGHAKSECTRSGPVCILCGNEGHISNDCDDIICHICFQTDHVAKKCPNSTQFLKVNCKRCGQRGHNEQICPDVWRQYKYTTAPGIPVVQRCSSQNKHGVFCANCSRIGHFTDQCSRNRMASRFLGPPPIMEIIYYEEVDIYKSHGLSYIKTPMSKKIRSKPLEAIDPIIMGMDVTGIINDSDLQSKNDTNDFDNECSTNHFEVEKKGLDFGDGYIMLSPISKPKGSDSRRRSLQQIKTPIVQCSTPGPKTKPKIATPVKVNEEMIDFNLPILPEALLKKLFPEETKDCEKLTPGLRAKLRKRLKKLLKNGYLPGDHQITQDRMEFWLQEISTGRSLSYLEKKNLLGSVSAALHSISDRVSDVTTAINPGLSFSEQDPIVIEGSDEEDIAVVTTVPESRRKKNKAMRQRKSLQNELRSIQRDNERFADARIDLTNDCDGVSENQPRKRKSVTAGKRCRSKKSKLKTNNDIVSAI